ncbi:MAG: hypothetical protein HQL39_13590 [Alphaproteobacteria bacterium]|nr:hypothetical protein [Alphaproteobacteria bacterium]
MARPSGLTERLGAAFLLGLVLFMPPLLAVFGQGGWVAGIPVAFLYLFGAWIALTLVLALIIERAPPDEAPLPPDEPAER